MSFDAEAYWANRSPKKWVVELSAGNSRDRLVVCADDEASAANTAIDHTMMPTDELEVTSVRLASPADLGLDVVGENPPHDLPLPRGPRFAPTLGAPELEDVMVEMERDLMGLRALGELLDWVDPGTQVEALGLGCIIDCLTARLQHNHRKLLP